MGTSRIRQLEQCDPKVFGDLRVTPYQHGLHGRGGLKVKTALRIDNIALPVRSDDDTDGECEDVDNRILEKRRCSLLVDQLLLEIYASHVAYTDYNSATSTKSGKYSWLDRTELSCKVLDELNEMVTTLEREITRAGGALVRRLKRRDALRRQRDARCDVISFLLRQSVPEFSPEMRFSLEPLPGDSGFSQWHSAMKMVSQLPEGIPPEFRRQLWLSLADKHLQAKGVDWPSAERTCFSEWSHPADAELGVQIVKDLHRTGCSLFCGKDGKENQALLKRVLLAYARWNKAVGYCQGFNMLAALILQVTEKSETDALKLMIYLIEGVLPDSYFADSLRGLSVDMAVFRELLRTKLPKLSKHLDTLQMSCKDGTASYEPPLTNVFTMQWFLTLFCNCLPQPTVLRVWDLILLEGNEILLRTSLAIWQVLADRIMTAKSADEFYCVMGMLMREILEFDLIDANTLVRGIVTIGPLTELSALREHYLYNINPWGGPPAAPTSNRRSKVYHREKLVLDIGVLKKQYTKLKQRQRQAHVIFNTAVARQTSPRPAPRQPAAPAVDHLLLGKSALVSARRSGPLKGAVPPPRQPTPKLRHPPKHQIQMQQQPPRTLHWKDARRDSSSSTSSTSSSDTELCDDPHDPHDSAGSDEDLAKCQLPEDNPSSTAPKATKPDLTSDQRLNQNDSDTSTIMSLCEDKSNDEIDNFNLPDLPENITYSVVPDLLDFVELPTVPTEDISLEALETIGTFDTLQILETDTMDTEASSDIFDLGVGVDQQTDEYFLHLDERLKRSDSLPSSEDGFDFEKFLEERVKCMKEKPYSSEESLEDNSELDRARYARRNSVRALEIIQENSLILHRILQCQSRLTPTPPPCEDLLYEDFGVNAITMDDDEVDNDVTPTNQRDLFVLNEEESLKYENDSYEVLNNLVCSNPEEEIIVKSDEKPDSHEITNYDNFICLGAIPKEQDTGELKVFSPYEDYSVVGDIIPCEQIVDNASEDMLCLNHFSSPGNSCALKSEEIDTSQLLALTDRFPRYTDGHLESPQVESYITSPVLPETNDKSNLYRPYENFADFIEQYKSKQDAGDHVESVDVDTSLTVEDINPVKLLRPDVESGEKSQLTNDVQNYDLSPILRQIDSVISPVDEQDMEEAFSESCEDLHEFTPESNISSFVNSFKDGADISCQNTVNKDNAILSDLSKTKLLLSFKPEETKPKAIFLQSYKDCSILINKYQEKYPSEDDGNNVVNPEVKDYTSSEILNQFETFHRNKPEGDELNEGVSNMFMPYNYQSQSGQDGGYTPTASADEISNYINETTTVSDIVALDSRRYENDISNILLENVKTCAESNETAIVALNEDSLVEHSKVKIPEIGEKSDYLAKLMGKYNITLSRSIDEPNKKPMENNKFVNNESEKSEKLPSESSLATMSSLSDFGGAPESMSPGNIVEVDYNLEKYRHKLGSPLTETIPELDSDITLTQTIANEEDAEEKEENDLIAIDKNSKYNSILEYSRNLDEKFNSLILKSPKVSKLQTNRLNLKSNHSLDVPDPRSDSTSPLSDESSRSEPRSSLSYSDLSEITSHATRTLMSTTEVDQPADGLLAESDRRKTIDVDALIESPNLRSPSRIYNPFPVSISSRQNKEVPFRLGLYKK